MRWTSRVLIAVVGLSDLVAGLTLLLQPLWFFEHVGHFAPYNQHYEGDAGAFVLAVGIGLVLAAMSPARTSGLLAVGVIASGLHLANHIYASVALGAPLSGTAIVAIQFLLLAAAAVLDPASLQLHSQHPRPAHPASGAIRD